MSYLSSSGNVGYSGLSQISEGSCATQYKMGVEGTSLGPSDEADLSYYPHSEQLFGSKLKVDGAEIFTFQDTDVVAGEITVCDDSEIKTASPKHAFHRFNLSNGYSDESSLISLTNGHIPDERSKDKSRITVTRSPERNNLSKTDSISEILASVGPDSPSGLVLTSNAFVRRRNSITSVNKEKQTPYSSISTHQSFLDVFKKEIASTPKNVSKEAVGRAPKAETKSKPAKRAPSTKSSFQRGSKPCSVSGGRGPALHEALQRIPPPAPPPPPPPPAPAPAPREWHAPGPHQYECTPLSDKKSHKTSSSDDETEMPNFGTWVLSGADDAAAGGGAARGARLAARRATLRRQVAYAAAELRLAPRHDKQACLATTVKKHLHRHGTGACLPTALVKQLLASRETGSVLSQRDISILRSAGWSGDERAASAVPCGLSGCGAHALPCAAYCLAHAWACSLQCLYTRCAHATLPARCTAPVLRGSALCHRHAGERDNYERVKSETKPKKPSSGRKRSSSGRSRRRPAPAPAPAPAHPHNHIIKDVNVCSNSSTYDSSEEAAIGGLSETEFMAAVDHESLDVEVDGVVLEAAQAPDDMLDSSVLNQIPDEAFTEFFNQGESGLCSGSEELKAALEAVLDERVLDSLDCFAQPDKLVSTCSPGVEMSSSATS